MSLLHDVRGGRSRANDLMMSKPDLKNLELQTSDPPENRFWQGLMLGSAIVAVPSLLVLVWSIHRPMPSESDRPPVPLEASATRRGGDQ